MIVSVATLTGAADVALGFPSLPIFFERSHQTAATYLFQAASRSGEYTVR